MCRCACTGHRTSTMRVARAPWYKSRPGGCPTSNLHHSIHSNKAPPISIVLPTNCAWNLVYLPTFTQHPHFVAFRSPLSPIDKPSHVIHASVAARPGTASRLPSAPCKPSNIIAFTRIRFPGAFIEREALLIGNHVSNSLTSSRQRPSVTATGWSTNNSPGRRHRASSSSSRPRDHGGGASRGRWHNSRRDYHSAHRRQR